MRNRYASRARARATPHIPRAIVGSELLANAVDAWAVSEWDGGATWTGHFGNHSAAMTDVVKLAHADQNPADAPFVGNYLHFPGVASSFISTDSTGLQPTATGGMGVGFVIGPDDLEPSSDTTLCGVWQEAGDERSWKLDLLTTGALRFSWSTDGTSGGVLSFTSPALSALDIPNLGVEPVGITVGWVGSSDGFRLFNVSWAPVEDIHDPGTYTQVHLQGGTATTINSSADADFVVGGHSVSDGEVTQPYAGLLSKLVVFVGGVEALDLDLDTADINPDHTEFTNDRTFTCHRSGGNAAKLSIVDESKALFNGSTSIGRITHAADLDTNDYIEVVARARVFDEENIDGVFVAKSQGTDGWNLALYLTAPYFSIGGADNTVDTLLVAGATQQPDSQMHWHHGWADEATQDAFFTTSSEPGTFHNTFTPVESTGETDNPGIDVTIGNGHGEVFPYAMELTHFAITHQRMTPAERVRFREALLNL